MHLSFSGKGDGGAKDERICAPPNTLKRRENNTSLESYRHYRKRRHRETTAGETLDRHNATRGHLNVQTQHRTYFYMIIFLRFTNSQLSRGTLSPLPPDPVRIYRKKNEPEPSMIIRSFRSSKGGGVQPTYG